MPNYYCVRMKDNEVLQYGLNNHLFAMYQQYGHQTTQTVTTLWSRILGINPGDWLVAIQAGVVAYAIGKVMKPRLQTKKQTDSIQRTITNRNHLYSKGIVHYDDCSIFYENFDDPPQWLGEYAQRIDVEEWQFLNRSGIQLHNIKANTLDSLPRECIFRITPELFKEIERDLKGNYMKDPKNVQLHALKTHKQIILQGPPGTSKTWTAKELTAHLLKVAPDKIEENRFSKKTGKGQWSIVQFHPSYNYEDFIRGIQIGTDTSGKICYQTVNRILGEMAEAAQKAIFNKKTQQSDQPASPEDSDDQQENKDTEETEALPYILIIDEINRANLAAVMGELIYALEYRDEAVDTPYEINSDFSLSVPPNLYIIGTMNTADRSVGHIDYAVRRRFVFIPCLPDATVLENYYDINHPTRTHLKKIALSLFHSVEKIFINDEGGYLTPDFFKDDVQVGHTYFMAKDCQELAMKFAYQVYPLLREYYKDGILIPREDGKIEIKIEAQSHPLVFKVDTPENCAEIFEQISSLCEEMSDSTASASAESAEEHSPDGENRESDPESFSEAEATQDDADQNDE